MKPIFKGYITYNSNYMIFWKRKNYGNGKINGCQDLEGEGRTGEAQRILKAVEIRYMLL